MKLHAKQHSRAR